MGAGGRMSVSSEAKNVLERVPCSKPPFTLGDVKKAIPPHCFKRFVVQSFYYVVQDIIIASLFYYIAINYITLLPPPLSYLAWPLYWFCQGSILSGLWVLGHDCGHHAFSNYQWLDDTVGFIVHSALFTPYFSWKYSHRRHHSNANSIDLDEVFVPKRKSSALVLLKLVNNPLGRVFMLLSTLTLGYPLYLFFNFSGRKYERYANHFNPHSPIYTERERTQIIFSDIGILTVAYALYKLILAKGVAWVICIHGIPLLVMTMFFILSAFLHHTHPSMPHYDSTEWDWLRGALSTVDRDFGLLNKVFHDATHTHVLHHLFSTIPHYHAVEATQAIKPVLGPYYKTDKTPILKAMWREAKECIYVEPDEDNEHKGVYWFHNKM